MTGSLHRIRFMLLQRTVPLEGFFPDFSAIDQPEQKSLVVKAVAQLDVDLSRLAKVRPTERVGAVQQEMAVCHIHRLQRDQPLFAEAFAKRDIKRRMTR